MVYIDEQKARLAGQIAYIDGICEHADKLQARHVHCLCSRSDRARRSHRAAVSRRNAKAVH